MDDYSQGQEQDSPRVYRSEKRRQQAENTRRSIIDAGRRLFVQQGYGTTSVSQIAAEAGVAEPTVYASVGGKRGILLALVDVVDDLGDEALIHEAKEEADPQRFIQLAMKYNRQILERGCDVIKLVTSTAAVDEEVAAVLQEALAKNREIAGELAQELAKRGSLQAHLTQKQTGDIIGLMLLPSVYDTLLSYGWSFDDCEAWVVDTLIKVLLSPEA